MKILPIILVAASFGTSLAATIVNPEDQLCRTLVGGECKKTSHCDDDETVPAIPTTFNRKWCIGSGLTCCVKRTACDLQKKGNCRDNCWNDETNDRAAGLCNTARRKCCVFNQPCMKPRSHGYPGGVCRENNKCNDGEVTPSHIGIQKPEGVRSWCEGSKLRCCVPEKQIRLVGDSEFRGRVEIFRNGEWGTICDHKFAAKGWPSVACKELGFNKATAAVIASATEIPVGTGTIHQKDLACRPHTARNMLECVGHDPAQTCTHENDVVITCEPFDWQTE